MESFAEKECSALGGLFQYIVNDLKIATPVWEDVLGKASKLHTHLKTTIIAFAAFLDSFQRIADMATNARGGTKDIGSALTRLCLRHRSVEAKLKIFSAALVDHLVNPLQEKLEDWKKVAYQMDKDHAKEYKRVRQDIKKKSSDTLRLQKKVRKAPKGDAKKTLDSAIRDVNSKYHLLEETEKQALRKALIEERSRYCLFVNCLRPVIESELSTMYEVTHIQEVVDALAKLIEDPQGLPPASEQVILDVKSSESGWSFRTPPGSPTSVSSRKSSTCSISSLNSSSSDSTHSPSAHQRSRSLSQPPSGAFRLSSVSSQDSGFTSQDTLFTRLPTPPPLELADQVSGSADILVKKDSPSYPDAPCAMSTWPNLQDTLQFEKAAASIAKSQRPHTISSAYERHNRPSLTSQTFRPLQNANDSDMEGSLDFPPEDFADDCSEEATPKHKAYPPPLPLRAEEMDMSAPTVPPKPRVLLHQPGKSVSRVATPSGKCPIYVNASDICPSSKATTPAVPTNEEDAMTSFQKSLAATLAQSAVHQKLLKESTAAVELQSPSAVEEGGACGGSVVPQPPVRRSSATKQAPSIPPHRSGGGREGTSWNVFSESSTDDGEAHAQLMRALNARLDALQRDEEVSVPPDKLPPPPPPLKEVVSSPVQDTSLDLPPHQIILRSAPTKKLPRPPVEKTLLSDLELKLHRRKDPPPTKFHTSPRQPLLDIKAQRRVSQPTFSEMLDQFPRHRVEEAPPTSATRRVPPTPDRRSSLDLEHASAQRQLVLEQSSRKANPVEIGKMVSQRQIIFEQCARKGSEDTASRVHKWLAGRGSLDVSQCRADLLGEIRVGVSLRKASSDDRSAPVLRHSKLKIPK